MVWVCVCVQKDLLQMKTEVERRVQETEKKLKTLPHFARQHKVSRKYERFRIIFF